MPDTPQSGLLGEARAALLASPIFALRELDVEQDGQQLLLSGTVSTFYQKQVAQEVVRSLADGVELVNKVQVVAPEAPSNRS